MDRQRREETKRKRRERELRAERQRRADADRCAALISEADIIMASGGDTDLALRTPRARPADPALVAGGT